MLLDALLAGVLALSALLEPPATRVEVLACRTREERLECVADIHVDPTTELLQEDVPVYTIGYLAYRTDGTPRVVRGHLYPVQEHALRRSIPVPLEALGDEAIAQPARVRLALFRSAAGKAAPAGARMMVALSKEVSLDDLPASAGWSPNPELYAGGDGSDCDEQAILVLAEDTPSGQHAEYDYIRGRYPGSEVITQGLATRGERQVDTFELRLANGSERRLCFDVTAFYGND